MSFISPLAERHVSSRVPRGWVTTLLAFSAAAVALTVPGLPGQVFGGIPLSPVALLVVIALACAAVGLPLPRRATRWLTVAFAVAAAVKVVVWVLAPPFGFTASYWATAQPSGTPERSTEFPGLWGTATRVDWGTLDLRGDEFPVYFLNDSYRFNIGGDARPLRDQMPFSVRWEGYLGASDAGERVFRLEAVGPARVRVGGATVAELGGEAGLRSSEGRAMLAAGPTPIVVEYTRPDGRVPRLQVAWKPTPGAPLEPLGAPRVMRTASAAGSGSLLWAAAPGLDALIALPALTWLVLGVLGLARAASLVSLARAGLAFLPFLFSAYAAAVNWDIAGRATIFSAYDDWLTHEGWARDILLNGPLMTNGEPSAPPYWAQVLYPYSLAVIHLVTGEGVFGAWVLNGTALGVTTLATTLLAARLFGALGGLAALALFWAFLQQEHLRIARQLLNENAYMPLAMACLLGFAVLAYRRAPPRWWIAGLLGILLGLTTLTRSPFVLVLPFGLLALLVAWWRAGAGRKAMAVALAAIVLGTVLAIAPATVRNWVVSGQLVVAAATAGETLVGGIHAPPRSMDLSGAAKNPVYEALKLDQNTRVLLEFIRQDPVGYFSTWVPNGAYSIGLTGVRRNDGTVYWGLFGTVLLYLASTLLVPRTRQVAAWPVHAFIWTHFIVLMAFEADAYGMRQPAPMYAPMVAIGVQLPVVIVQWLVRAFPTVPAPARRWAPSALAGLFVLGAVFQFGRGLVDLWPRRELQYYGMGGAAALGVSTADREGADRVYVASGDGSPRRFGAGNLPGLRYASLKWFDPARSVPLPPDGTRAVYLLAEAYGSANPAAQQLVSCLGLPGPGGVKVITGEEAARFCLTPARSWQPMGARFADVAEVETATLSPTANAGGNVDASLFWTVLRRPKAPLSIAGRLRHSSSEEPPRERKPVDLYPSSEWEPGERILSRLTVPVEDGAIPGSYQVLLDFFGTRGEQVPLPSVRAGGDPSPNGGASLGTVDVRPAAPTPRLVVPTGLGSVSVGG